MKKREQTIEWIKKQLQAGEDPKKIKRVVEDRGIEPELVDYLQKKLI